MSPIETYYRLPASNPRTLGAREVYPFGSGMRVGDVTFNYAPRMIPENARKAVITSNEQMFALSCLPGVKVVEVPDSNYVTYLSALTMSTALNSYKPHPEGKDSAILATGGTWDPPRLLLGNPDLARSILGSALPLDRGLLFTCLDEYGFLLSIWRMLQEEVGSREIFLNGRLNPISYGDIHRLFLQGAGFTEADFRFPPFGFDAPGIEVARAWRRILFREIFPSVTGNHGIGSYPFHDAFNDYTGFLDPTGFFGIADSTKLQNGNDTTPPGAPQMSPMFRNIAAAYGISERESVFIKAKQLREDWRKGENMPEQFQHYIGDEAWNSFMTGLDTEIDIARVVTGRMPTNVITMGLRDLIFGNGTEETDSRSADLHIFSITGGHKAPAFYNCLCKPANEANPASALNFYGRVIVFVDRLAAHYAHKFNEEFTATFWKYKPDGNTEDMIRTQLTASSISDRFWANYESNPDHWRWPD
ncbi:MAG: hypothetical protein WC490_02235 [Candidatus Margulisiibacteriota bacterium]